MSDYDLAVIGAGSAGFSAAIAGAELGARVALIGRGRLGGTCVNVGCIPSKTLIRAMGVLHQADAASRFAGIRAKGTLESWSALRDQKDALVRELRQAKYADLLPTYDKVSYLEGAARLAEGAVSVDGRRIKAAKVIVATGASPALPDITGIGAVGSLTSTTAMDLERLPESLLVIGGGYIGCELAQMFARAGVQVTLLCRSRLLPRTEPDIAEALTDYFREEGITVHSGSTYHSVRQTDRGTALELARDGSRMTVLAEKLLIATGRRPHTAGLGVREVGVALSANGGIAVDDHLQTSNPHIYAAGDVTGRHQFVYMAAYGARLAAENALNGNSRRYDVAVMPTVTFTDPQVAGVGLTESEARAQGLPVKTALLPLSYLPRALAARDTRGLIKLVVDAGSDRLLGAHILAPEGCDSIQTAALALKNGMTARDLAETIFPYLTTVEGLKLAAQTFDKDVSKLSCCAG